MAVAFSEMLARYRADHQNPVNRALHTIGIPTIVVSILMLPFAPLWALGLFGFGWALQFIGHAFEGKKPSFFSDPRYMLVGVAWFVQKIRGRGPNSAG